MTPQDVENCITRIVEYRNSIITGSVATYSPGVFQKIADDIRALRRAQADVGEEIAIVRAEGDDGIRRFPKWAQSQDN